MFRFVTEAGDGYALWVIVIIRHRGLRRLHERNDPSGISASQAPRIRRILTALNRANGPAQMDLPGFRNHPLTGSRAGFWAVTVTKNQRIIFRFEDGHATDVDLLDYH